MNKERGKTVKDDVGRDFFKLMNNSIFGHTVENVRKHQTQKIEKKVHQSESNYLKTNFFFENYQPQK